jgi:hypothetical protein
MKKEKNDRLRDNAFLRGKLVGKINVMEFTRKYPLVLLVKAG